MTFNIPAAPTRPMSEEEIRQAKLWFIQRFVHSIAPKNFCLRLHGLQNMTIDQRKKMVAMRLRNQDYDFIFTPTEQGLVITPVTAQAAWAQGIIFVTDSTTTPGEVDFNYRTLPQVDLFTQAHIIW